MPSLKRRNDSTTLCNPGLRLSTASEVREKIVESSPALSDSRMMSANPSTTLPSLDATPVMPGISVPLTSSIRLLMAGRAFP